MTPLPTHRPWSNAMQEALYGPDGFFVREAPAAHFRTSVTASTVFAQAVRRLAGLVDDALGRPDPFDLVDLGSGRGELLTHLPNVPARWRLTGVDLAAGPPGLAWSSTVPVLDGLLIANEWLDNVPLEVLFDGQVVQVAPDGTEQLGGPGSPADLEWAARWWPQGRRVEVGLSRDLAWTAAVGQVRRGLAVAVDYGHQLGNRSEFGDRRPTLTGYRDGRQVPPLPDGSCDLTAHVALDALAAATSGQSDSGQPDAGQPDSGGSGAGRILTQRAALALLDVRAEPPPLALSRTDPHGYLAQLAQSSAAAELLDRRGLGGFGWVVVPVGIDDPLVGRHIGNP